MGFRKGIIKSNCLARGFFGKLFALSRGDSNVVARRYIVGVGEAGVSQGVVGIGSDCLLKKANAPFQSFLGATVPELTAFEKEPVGFRIVSARATNVLL